MSEDEEDYAYKVIKSDNNAETVKTEGIYI